MKNKLEEYRKKKKLTQEQLAEKVGVARKTICLIENGSVIPKIDLAFKIAIELDVIIDTLFINSEYNSEHINDIRISKEEQEHFMNNFAQSYLNINK